MQKILNKITEKLKKFIKSDSEMKTKGIRVKIGKYGKYLSFTAIIPENQGSN